MSFQTDGSKWRLAAISSMKMDGMISAGANMIDSAVIDSNEKPKPEYPRTMAAKNTHRQA